MTSPPTEPPNGVAFCLTEEDVIAATRLHHSRSGAGRFGVFLVAGLFIWYVWSLVAIAAVPRNESATAQIGQCAFVLCLIAIYCADLRFGLPRRARKSFRRVATLSEPTTLSWTDSGLQLKTLSSRLVLPWNKITRCLENARVLIILQSQNEIIILPKRALPPPLLDELMVHVTRVGR